MNRSTDSLPLFSPPGNDAKPETVFQESGEAVFSVFFLLPIEKKEKTGYNNETLQIPFSRSAENRTEKDAGTRETPLRRPDREIRMKQDGGCQ